MTDTEPSTNAHQGWDDFWSEIQAEQLAERGDAATETVRGVLVKVPFNLPMRFERLLDGLDGSATGEKVRQLLVDLFGVDVLDQWIDAGMDSLEFKVVLRWSIAHGRGRPITFREAYEQVKAMPDDENEDGGGSGKDDSTPTKSGSASSGRSSKPTSTANTGSPRRASRR